MSEFPANPEDVAAQISTTGDEWSEDHWPDRYSLVRLDWDSMVNPHSSRMTNIRIPRFNHEPKSEMQKHLERRQGNAVTILISQPREVKASAWHDFDGEYYFKLHPLDEKLSGGMRASCAERAIMWMIGRTIQRSMKIYRANR